MKILICGDVMGKSGRRTIEAYIPVLREKLGLDFVIVNGENAAHGFGITEKMCREFFDLGVDVITTGNHVWDQREIMNYIGDEPRLLRPINYPEHTPGAGAGVFETNDGLKVTVIHPMGRLFMEALDDPFACVEKELAKHRLGASADAIVVDVHGEATSEKMAMGHFLDGRVSVVVGSHSHVPTADAQILPGGTAYQTDMGMCGDYDSVIGMLKDRALARFTTKLPTSRLEPAEREGTLCAVYVETNDGTGLAEQVYPVRVGGRLAGALPEGA
ncbi:MAG: TIGR00282 family metallophosphoesterase [Rhodospirillales bacterium]